jgi:hypothetical protein
MVDFTTTYTTITTFMRFALFEASPLFAKSDAIGKRIKRTKRMKTDFFPPAADSDEPKASQSPFSSV